MYNTDAAEYLYKFMRVRNDSTVYMHKYNIVIADTNSTLTGWGAHAPGGGGG